MYKDVASRQDTLQEHLETNADLNIMYSFILHLQLDLTPPIPSAATVQFPYSSSSSSRSLRSSSVTPTSYSSTSTTTSNTIKRRLTSSSNLSSASSSSVRPRSRSLSRGIKNSNLSGKGDKFDTPFGKSPGHYNHNFHNKLSSPAGNKAALVEDDRELGKHISQDREDDDLDDADNEDLAFFSSDKSGFKAGIASDGSSNIGNKKKKPDLLRCERCHKVYHHPQSLIKRALAIFSYAYSLHLLPLLARPNLIHLIFMFILDRWQHTDIWSSASSYGLSKHATVQALEAAVILANPSTLRLLPDDRSHWPAAVSPASSGLLGSEQVNLDILRDSSGHVNGFYSKSMPVRHSRLGTSAPDEESSVVDEEMEEDEETSSEDDLGILSIPTGGTPGDVGLPGGDMDMDTMDQNMFSMDLNRLQSSSTSSGTSTNRTSNFNSISNLNYMRSGSGTLASLPSNATITAPHSHSRTRSTAINPSSRNVREQSISSTGTTASISTSTSGGEGLQGEEANEESISGSETKDSGYTSGSVLATSGGGEEGWMERPALHTQDPEHHPSQIQLEQSHASAGGRLTVPQLVTNPGQLGHLNGHVSLSAPVLGFFTEVNKQASNQVKPPIIASQHIHHSSIIVPESSNYKDLEVTAAEVLSSSSHSHPRSLSRSPYPRPQLQPHTSSSQALSSTSRAQSRSRSINASLNTKIDIRRASSPSYSLGQAPILSSSFRSSSLSRSIGQASVDSSISTHNLSHPQEVSNHEIGDKESETQVKREREGRSEKEEKEEEEDQLMDMDL